MITHHGWQTSFRDELLQNVICMILIASSKVPFNPSIRTTGNNADRRAPCQPGGYPPAHEQAVIYGIADSKILRLCLVPKKNKKLYLWTRALNTVEKNN